MLSTLSIRNYALITELEVEFGNGLTTITGETGAGKSILMGALSLVLGSRADSSVVREASEKCIVEAQFLLESARLKPLFDQNDLDWSKEVVIRREINGQGKSRAFINDTPVTLSLLKEVGDVLVDIHAQHQNLLIASDHYPLSVIDKFGGLDSRKQEYQVAYQQWKEKEKELHQVEAAAREATSEKDYLSFQFDQLEQASLSVGEEEELEDELATLTYAGEIHQTISQAIYTLNDQEFSVLAHLKQMLTDLERVSEHTRYLLEPVQRMQSSFVELQDLSRDLNQLVQKIEQNPARLQEVSDRLDLLRSLQHKHQCTSVQDLIDLKEDIDNRLKAIEFSDERIVQLKLEVTRRYELCHNLANQLSMERNRNVPILEKQVTQLVKDLGMPHGQFEVKIMVLERLDKNGLDAARFFFTANKNQVVEELSKVASGGEKSRLMLCLKSLISASIDIPTLIFDEIDTGVSGEIAFKMGAMIRNIGEGRQVLNITHLPQVAANGDQHYLVYKYDDEHVTHTTMRALNPEERITELAKMLSGEKITDEAVQNAKVLLGKKGK